MNPETHSTSSGQARTCQNCKQNFVIEPEDSVLYESLDLPLPERCSYCRLKYLSAFFTHGRFRITTSALSGKRIITVLPESVPFPIYDREEYFSDAWDPFSYGRDYDPSRSFIDQVVELQSVVPHPHQAAVKNVNCDWTDDMWESRNVYLSRSALQIDSVSYGYRLLRCKNSMDITYCFDTERSYDCLYCTKCYGLRHSFNCRDCIGGAFLYDCRNCQDCFMSWNLRNKKYHILNQPYSKEEYFEKLKEFDLKSYAAVERLKKEFWEHVQNEAVHRSDYNVQTYNSDGNFMEEVKNCRSCYFISNSENCRYCLRGIDSKDSIDLIMGIGEKCGISCQDEWGYGNVCVLYVSHCRYSAYLNTCEECEHCLGCVGLRKKKYCILNKQYTEGEYKKLSDRIKSDMKQRGEWGEYFPLSAAYAGYNYSLANMMFPLSKEEIVAFGAEWEEPQTVNHEGISGNDLPDRIDDVKDDIVKQRIICPETGLSYNIAAHELAFYREYGIPLPRRHFEWRTFDRFKPFSHMIIPRRGKCFYCGKDTEHYYGPGLGFKKIACVECYQKEIA